MVITVEPGAYIIRIGGARWEDMVLADVNGRELLMAGKVPEMFTAPVALEIQTLSLQT